MTLSTRPTDTEAKAATKTKRDALRAAWRANADVGFTKLDAAQYAPDYAALAKSAIDARKYTDVTAADIQGYISGRPAKSLLNAYTEGLEGWKDRVAHPRPTYGDVAYEGPSLTSRGPMAWGSKALAAAAAQPPAADADRDANMLMQLNKK